MPSDDMWVVTDDWCLTATCRHMFEAVPFGMRVCVWNIYLRRFMMRASDVH